MNTLENQVSRHLPVNRNTNKASEDLRMKDRRRRKNTSKEKLYNYILLKNAANLVDVL